MNRRFDFAQSCYWRMQFVEPQQDNRQYVMLFGEEGEIVGPLTMALAEAWIDHFSFARQWPAGPHNVDRLHDSEGIA